MNLLDVVVVIVAVSAGVGGYRLGFVTRSLSWFGMLVGFVVAVVLLPTVADSLDSRASGELVLAVAALLIGGALLGQALGLAAGARLRKVLPPQHGVRMVDHVGGAVAGVLGVLVGLWLLLPTMTHVPGWPARESRNSALARTIQDVFPEPPDAVQVLRDRFPQVFEGVEPAPDLGPPPSLELTGLSPETVALVRTSVLKIEGAACQRLQEGSGFAIAEELVVTNAHVVAGEAETRVVRDDGAVLVGKVVTFDASRDLALIQVDGLERPPMALADAAVGDRGAVFGFPGGGPLEISPFQIGEHVEADGRDLYDKIDTQRDVYFLASQLQAGDSGAVLADSQGRAVGVAFAVAPDDPNVAYALSAEEVREVLDAPRQDNAVGPCVG